MNDYTYDEALYLSAQLIAMVETHTSTMQYEHIIDACLIAGKLRGMIVAGEPSNSHQFEELCHAAAALQRYLYSEYEVDGVPI